MYFTCNSNCEFDSLNQNTFTYFLNTRWQETERSFGDDSNERERGLGTQINL